MLAAGPAFAQVDQSVTLDEVTIKAEKVVSKTDGWLLYPTSTQKQSSRTGYALLQKMSLPNIRVDEIDHSVSSIDQRGGVQLRINDIIVGNAEMLSLDPGEVKRIDFIDNPGVRYGEGIAYVINIITKRAESGYAVGTDLTHGLTALGGNGSVFGKWNTGKSEWALNYNTSYNHSRNSALSEETAHYHLNDGSVYTVTRNDFASKNTSYNNAVRLSYNLAEADDYVFQTSFNTSFNRMPTHWSKKNITDSRGQSSVATERSENRGSSPVVDVYFSKQLPANQSLVLNAVGTYIRSSGSNSYDEGKEYSYEVKGKTYSVMSEGIYENKFKPLTFSAGFNLDRKSTRNEYTGSTRALNKVNNSRLYLFSDVRGHWKDFRYTAGLGVNYLHYSQDEHQFDYWTFSPKLSLTYNFTNELQLSYNFNIRGRMSQIAMVSDAVIQNNPMEYTKGSPDLKPSTDVENQLRLSYNNSRLQTFVDGFYRHCHRPNMALYERTEDDKFIYTQKNQKQISCFQTMLYANYWLVPEKLSLSASGGLFRCFNYGDNYTHCYTSYFVTGSVNAYLGNFTLSAYADNGFRFLEGETKGVNGGATSIKAAYNIKAWQFALSWQQPFTNRYKVSSSEVLNENLQKSRAFYSRDAGNYVSLNISWRFNAGRKYHSPERSRHLKDNDTGILKK